MKNKDLFNALVTRAAKERPPQVDVADSVIGTLTARDKQLERIWERPLMWIAALSSAAAVPFAALAIFLHNIWTGPLYEISKAISWVM